MNEPEFYLTKITVVGEGVTEWWLVANGVREFRTKSENDARWLLKRLSTGILYEPLGW